MASSSVFELKIHCCVFDLTCAVGCWMAGPSKKVRDNYSALCLLCKRKNRKLFESLCAERDIQIAIAEILFQVAHQNIEIPKKFAELLRKEPYKKSFLDLISKRGVTQLEKQRILRSQRGSGILDILEFVLPIVATLL